MFPLLLSLLSVAEAKKTTTDATGGATVVEGKAPWETKAGKEETKLEMIDALIRANNPQEALSLIADMRKSGSEQVTLDVLQGKALRRLGLFDDADEILRDAIKHHPREASAHNELGLLLLERREVDAALPELKTATKQEPDNPDFLNNYGFALMSAGKPEAAVAPLRAALRLDGTRERTRNNLGFALVANGKPDEAYRLFRSSQTEADARYNVGYGLELQGEREKALVEYHSALASNPEHKRATEGIQRLDPFEKQTDTPPSRAPAPPMIDDPETP
jgi:pentatricopeptide repeat protein